MTDRPEQAAERAALGAMLKDNARVPEVRAALAWQDFYADAHQRVCRVVFELADEGAAIDPVTAYERLVERGWHADLGAAAAFLTELADACPSPAAAATYAESVKRESQRRALALELTRLAGLSGDRRVPLDFLQGELGKAAINGHAAKDAAAFPAPIPASMLKAAEPGQGWVVTGLLKRGEVTLLSALWKSGKTTLLAHMLRAFGKGGTFIGRQVVPSKVLYVTEESEARWADRRDAVGIEDHAEFLVRPWKTKPSIARWEEFVAHVGALVAAKSYDVVVFDTLANLWPVRDENDASAVQASLMPLHAVTEKAALQLVHHTRKSDGPEATASRGSGALTGFVDTILEFRRYLPADRKDRRRVLTGFGRDDETPDELVIELTQCGYVCHGDRESVRDRDLGAVIGALLPGPPGLTMDQVLEAWPEDGGVRPGRKALTAALKAGAEQGSWVQTGGGVRGQPRLYFAEFGGA